MSLAHRCQPCFPQASLLAYLWPPQQQIHLPPLQLLERLQLMYPKKRLEVECNARQNCVGDLQLPTEGQGLVAVTLPPAWLVEDLWCLSFHIRIVFLPHLAARLDALLTALSYILLAALLAALLTALLAALLTALLTALKSALLASLLTVMIPFPF